MSSRSPQTTAPTSSSSKTALPRLIPVQTAFNDSTMSSISPLNSASRSCLQLPTTGIRRTRIYPPLLALLMVLPCQQSSPTVTCPMTMVEWIFTSVRSSAQMGDMMTFMTTMLSFRLTPTISTCSSQDIKTLLPSLAGSLQMTRDAIVLFLQSASFPVRVLVLLINRPSRPTCDTTTVTTWHSQIANVVRQLDPNHLISSGCVLLFHHPCPFFFLIFVPLVRKDSYACPNSETARNCSLSPRLLRHQA